MKIYIRGAGDLATGIACRLYESGFQIMMTDLKVPTTVRRTVAFSPAIYMGETIVEGKKGTFCSSCDEVNRVFDKKGIPIVIDSDNFYLHSYNPDVVIDAIVAKNNIATKISDAPIVIAIGPGFTAGEDCHCVIESMRGHDLGRCIYNGKAMANTGVPGDIGGFTKERILRATQNGTFKGIVKIGDMVEKGQVVAFSGQTEIKSELTGLVRGILQDGVQVRVNMKVGDVDPRAKKEHCYTISDKARAIGGGVLEAILHCSASFDNKSESI